ncbi:MAG: phytanoyl-CoA dioxygenase family protein [Opitutales bacterium]
MTVEPQVEITESHQKQFQERGFFLLERAMTEEVLERLRGEVDRFIEAREAEMREKGVEKLGLDHLGKRYFIQSSYKKSQIIHDFIFSELMAAICRATVGANARFFFDQWVIKAAEKGIPFSWHQDSGYVPFDHTPYVTCWTPLDDVDESNGTVYLLPYDRLGVKSRVQHIKDPETNDMVGYFGEDPGDPVRVPAGSVAVFSSVCFHRSGYNQSANMRRVLLTQYSPEIIKNPWTDEQLFQGLPFLENGVVTSENYFAAEKA